MIRLTFALIALTVVLLVKNITAMEANRVTSNQAAAITNVVTYQNIELPHSKVHVVTIPNHSKYQVMPMVAEELETVENLAKRVGAIAAINGGYFDPVNGQTTSYITINGEIVADPRTNSRLIDNPQLQSYMPLILNRSELRRYQCGQEIAYDITLHSDYTPTGCKLLFSLGAGPQLLPKITAVKEGFLDYQNEQVIRDAIVSRFPNPRSAVGIKANGDIMLVMVGQTSFDNLGMTLNQLAEFLSEIGVEKALNLDGGSSSSLYYGNPRSIFKSPQVFWGRLDKTENWVKRPVKSILVVK